VVSRARETQNSLKNDKKTTRKLTFSEDGPKGETSKDKKYSVPCTRNVLFFVLTDFQQNTWVFNLRPLSQKKRTFSREIGSRRYKTLTFAKATAKNVTMAGGHADGCGSVCVTCGGICGPWLRLWPACPLLS